MSCDDVRTDYAALFDEASSCDPDQPNQCTERASTDLYCGCLTFLNAARWDAKAADELAKEHEALGCSAGIACGPCMAPLRGYCNVDGKCTDAYDIGGQPGCRVNGVIYTDGESGVPDPTSCNSCTCLAGQLACDDANCPLPCPSKTKLATSCAQCGPNDSCEIVEYSCRPTCTDTCAEGTCIDGACLVGFCG